MALAHPSKLYTNTLNFGFYWPFIISCLYFTKLVLFPFLCAMSLSLSTLVCMPNALGLRAARLLSTELFLDRAVRWALHKAASWVPRLAPAAAHAERVAAARSHPNPAAPLQPRSLAHTHTHTHTHTQHPHTHSLTHSLPH
jgi:hypothetical protein